MTVFSAHKTSKLKERAMQFRPIRKKIPFRPMAPGDSALWTASRRTRLCIQRKANQNDNNDGVQETSAQ
jgi:hypothetical protein